MRLKLLRSGIYSKNRLVMSHYHTLIKAKPMKNFKQFYTEAMSKHLDAFLILMGDIKLDRGNACKIWGQCGTRSKFRHITDGNGAKFLINNKDKNVMISAMKHGKRTKGILSYGNVILLVDADYEIWFPEDAYTFVGADGKRWTSPRARRFTDIFGDRFLEDYKSGMRNLIKSKHPELQAFLSTTTYYTSDGANVIGESEFEYDFNSVNESSFVEWSNNNKKLVDKFTKDALDYQLNFLDKHSKDIQSRLLTMFKDATKSKDNRSMYKEWQDEAVVSNVKVDKVYIKGFDMMVWKQFFDNYEKLFGDSISSKHDEKDIVDYTFDFIDDWNYKGQFTFMDSDGKFTFIKKYLNKKYDHIWDKLQKYGIVRDKGIYLRVKK